MLLGRTGPVIIKAKSIQNIVAGTDYEHEQHTAHKPTNPPFFITWTLIVQPALYNT